MKISARISIEKLFYEISREWFVENNFSYESNHRSGIFSSALTVWLMILQRLVGASLQGVLIELLDKTRESIFVEKNTRSKKLAFNNISISSGGLTQARQRIESEQISKLVEHSIHKLKARLPEEKNIYMLDGLILTTEYTEKNEKTYTRTSIGQGKLHFPRLRAVAAHSLENGTALKPLFADLKKGEQVLTWDYLTGLPNGCTVMGDRNFGVFSVVHRASSLGHKVLFRLNIQVFNKIAGEQKKANCEVAVTWTPSRHDLKATPAIPQDAAVSGRCIKMTVRRPGTSNLELYFFTTLDISGEEIAALYLQRQRIETHIKQIKSNLKLEFIRAKTPDMISKEIHIAYLTFNLLSAIMMSSAQRNNLAFERISFTATMRLVEVIGRQIEQAENPKQVQKLLSIFDKAMFQAKIPERKKRRSFPRVIKRCSKYNSQGIVQNA
jgi:Transposase DDE domain